MNIKAIATEVSVHQIKRKTVTLRKAGKLLCDHGPLLLVALLGQINWLNRDEVGWICCVFRLM